MKLNQLAYLAGFGLTTVLFRRRDPLVGSLILTDRCNLACRHCAVANQENRLYPYSVIRQDLESLYRSGVRILLFYGGEPFLWQDGSLTLADLIREARTMGFYLISVVTNGTLSLDLPEADLVLVSLDGTRAHHDAIRGRTYDRILQNIAKAPRANLALYMAVNRINQGDLEAVAKLARTLPNVRAAAYNFHTPYPGTESLTLTDTELEQAAQTLKNLKRDGLPILNLVRSLPALLDHRYRAPCSQCLLVQNGRTWVCGRCSDIPGLCGQCGFTFATEFSMLFRGHPGVIAEALRTYLELF